MAPDCLQGGLDGFPGKVEGCRVEEGEEGVLGPGVGPTFWHESAIMPSCSVYVQPVLFGIARTRVARGAGWFQHGGVSMSLGAPSSSSTACRVLIRNHAHAELDP
jgi:hypothetical protein